MPYFITDSSPDCSGWATIKDDGEVIGCHQTKQDAIDQMIAVSIAENIEPGGERALPDNYRPSLSNDVPDGRACGNCYFYDESNIKEYPNGELRAWCEKWDDYVNGAYYCNAWQPDEESDDDDQFRAGPNDLEIGDFVSWNNPGGRARGQIERIERDGEINVPDSDFTITGTEDDPAALITLFRETDEGYEATDRKVAHKFSTLTKINDLRTREKRQVNLEPPAYMRAAARRGLQYLQDGFGGDGLTDKTKREARLMADGQVSEDKWIRIAAWIARHMPDLDAPKNNDPSDSQYPGPGLVAHLLWGSGPSKRAAQRAMEYAQGVVERIRQEEEQARWSSVSVQLKKEKENKMPSTVERRTNDVTFEIRASEIDPDKMTFTGYAAVFNSPSEPLPFTEYIMPGAFKRSLKSRNQIKLFVNHNMDRVLASTRSGTLKLSEDSKGLLAEAQLPPTTDGRDLSILMQRGDVNSMSFGFSVPARGDKWSDDGMKRELHQIRLHEVSIVTGFPAYEATTATVRAIDALATRTGIDPDKLADALTRLEAGETLQTDHAGIINEAVEKLKENTPNTDELLEIKRKQLDLLIKAI
jgi:HK97 family phage prohead protease